MARMIDETWRRIRTHQRMLTSAVVCNPTLVLYSINKVLSIFRPIRLLDTTFDVRIDPLLDVHAHDKSCKVFVVLMVALQLVLYVPRNTELGTIRGKGNDKADARDATVLASQMKGSALEKLNVSACYNPRVQKT